MSVSIFGLPNAAVSATGLLGQLVHSSATVQTRLSLLTEQSSTGLVSQTYGGLGSNAQISLDLRPQLARVDVYTQNISQASTNLNMTSQVLDQLQSIASSFYSSTLGLSAETAQEADTLASQATTALSQVQTLLNTQVGGSYLLAGEDTSNAPAPDAAFNAYVQSIQTAAAGLPIAGGAATVAATLAAASSGSPFSSTLGTTPKTVTVGFGVTEAVGVVAGINAFASQTAAGSTGSYMRDLIRSLATISSMNSSEVSLGTNFTTLLDDTRTNLGNAITAINNESAGIGASQQALTMDQTTLTDMQQAMTKQVSSVENVDAAATATALTQAQTQLQISYKMISSMQSLSLVQYLP